MINKNKNQKTYKRARYLAPQHGLLTIVLKPDPVQ